MIISLSYILHLCWDMIKILRISILSQIWSKMQAINYISSWSFYSAVFLVQFSPVAQSCPTLQPRGLQHVQPPCPSPTPRVYSNSYPLSQWCHPTISSSVVSFSSHLQSVPASGSFQVSQFFESYGQIIGASASALVPLMNNQDWFPLGWTGWISLLSKALKNLLQHQSSKTSILWCSAFFIVKLSHPYVTTRKTVTLTRWTFIGNVSAF